MGKTFDEALSIISDVAGFIPGFQWAPLVGNSVAGADEASRGDFLSAALSAVGAGSGILGHAAGDAVGGAVQSALNPAVAETTDQFLASGGQGFAAGLDATKAAAGAAAPLANAATTGAQLALGAGAGPLFQSLGLRDTAPQNSGPQQTAITPAAKGGLTGAGGGAGPGLGAGGLDIQGGTAPKIYPYVQSNQGPPTGSTNQQQSSAGTSGSGQQSGMQQQSRSI
jgi:hypothetical protein